jgi:hypothetical protein
MSEKAVRKSSFARAFFASGAGGEDLSGGAEGADGATGKNCRREKSRFRSKVLCILTVASFISGFDDEEVLEQYRIMAQHEAAARVKESVGFDQAEYDERRKQQEDELKLQEYRAKLKITMAEPKLSAAFSSPGSMLKPEEPPLPPAVPNRKFIEQRAKRVPELCIGRPVGRGANVPDDEHVVTCLGPCRGGLLAVKTGATLVSCPTCKTVSPASSTRR